MRIGLYSMGNGGWYDVKTWSKANIHVPARQSVDGAGVEGIGDLRELDVHMPTIGNFPLGK